MEQKVILTDIAFNRIVLHISGEVQGFDNPQNLGARFVSDDGRVRLHPQSFKIDGNKFELTINVLSANKEMPIDTGNYYLKLFVKYDNKFKKQPETVKTKTFSQFGTVYRMEFDSSGELIKKTPVTTEVSAYLSPEMAQAVSDSPDNPMNLIVFRNLKNQFNCISAQNLDTEEFYLKVEYIPPVLIHTWKDQRMKDKEFRDLEREKRIGRINVSIFRTMFSIFSKLHRYKGDRILFTSGSRASLSGNEKFIYDRMIERGLDKRFKFFFDFKESIQTHRSKLKMMRFVYLLATCDIIILDDYYPEIYTVDFPKNVKVIQVWHACGAFKTVGLERTGKIGAPEFNTPVHKCYTHVPVSSEHSALHNAEAFCIDTKKFYPVGVPRTDIFFDEEYKKQVLERMYKEFPRAKEAKKVYLYAPTFRGNDARTAWFPFYSFDLEAWGKFLKETDSYLIIKMHPFVTEKVVIPPEYKDYIIDATPYREVNDILFIVDVMITDYSSIIYEFSLLRRPMLFYAFDQKTYEAERDFYEPYVDLVPGKIVKTFPALMKAMEDEDFEFGKIDAFVKKNFTYTDGKATDRVIDQLIL